MVIEELMKTLGCTKDEALALIQEDREIDRMTSAAEIDADLTEEQKESSKKARHSDRKPSVYKLNSKREKKENKGKRFLIEELRASLEEASAANMVVINPERELNFTFEGVKYKLVLSAPRS